MRYINLLFAALTCSMWLSSAQAAVDVQLKIELPRLQVAEYHKPYLAVWLEDAKRQTTQVSIWYDLAMPDAKGEEWLADLRQWWRRGGRSLALPIDGITGATKGPGEHTIDVSLQNALAGLPDGQYQLRVEAVREVGGRELLTLKVQLPLELNELPMVVIGQSELSKISLISQANSYSVGE